MPAAADTITNITSSSHEESDGTSEEEKRKGCVKSLFAFEGRERDARSFLANRRQRERERDVNVVVVVSSSSSIRSRKAAEPAASSSSAVVRMRLALSKRRAHSSHDDDQSERATRATLAGRSSLVVRRSNSARQAACPRVLFFVLALSSLALFSSRQLASLSLSLAATRCTSSSAGTG